LQNLFDTGLLGALIVTIVGSISWQLVASAFPIAFLSNPFVYILLRICLLLEATGLCSGAWVLAKFHKKMAGFKRDEVYIGTAEERARRAMGDIPDQIPSGPGHPLKLPIVPEMDVYDYSLAEIKNLETDLRKHEADLAERLEDLQRRKQAMLLAVKYHEYVCTECGHGSFHVDEKGENVCDKCPCTSFRVGVTDTIDLDDIVVYKGEGKFT